MGSLWENDRKYQAVKGGDVNFIMAVNQRIFRITIIRTLDFYPVSEGFPVPPVAPKRDFVDGLAAPFCLFGPPLAFG